MDIGTTGCSGYYLRVATLSSEVFLHQAKVDIEAGGSFIPRRMDGFSRLVRFYREKGATIRRSWGSKDTHTVISHSAFENQ